jgi:hypothetical protein
MKERILHRTAENATTERQRFAVSN